MVFLSLGLTTKKNTNWKVKKDTCGKPGLWINCSDLLWEKNGVISKFLAFSLEFQKIFSITSTIYSNGERSKQFLVTECAALKNPLQDFKNSFCFGFLWVPSVLEGKKRETPFFKVQSGKITVRSVLYHQWKLRCYFWTVLKDNNCRMLEKVSVTKSIFKELAVRCCYYWFQ